MSLKLQLSPFSPISQLQSPFHSRLLPRVRDSSVLQQTRNASPNRPLMFKQVPNKAKDESEDSIELSPRKKKPENVTDNLINKHFIKPDKFNDHNKNNGNNTIERKNMITFKKIVDVPSIDSQERFFSLGDAIEVNNKSTEALFKREPAILLRILYNDTDNSLNLWDFGYLNVFMCEVLGPEQQLEEMGNECAVFIPVDKSTIQFAPDEVVVVENPFFLIRDMNPPLLIAPVLYHRPESMRSQPSKND